MRQTRGRANPQLVRELVALVLDESETESTERD
jgi:Asp-tRNA(Asn)/Glu-tRNA(Gln) amidotransferase B subunit